MVEGMSECLEVYSVAITSPDCHYHAIKNMPTFPEDAEKRESSTSAVQMQISHRAAR